MLNQPTPTLVPHPTMARTSRPNLIDNNVPARYLARRVHPSDNQQTSLILEALRNFDSSQYARPNSHTRDVDSPNRARSSSVHAHHRGLFAPLAQPLASRPMSVPQPSQYLLPSMSSIMGRDFAYARHNPNHYMAQSAGNNHSLPPPPAAPTSHRQMPSGGSRVSRNYQGDPDLPANQSADIPDELNTAVWITNLPPNVNHKMLLNAVRNCGKIFAAVINGPEPGHITAASKLVFFDVEGAKNLLRQACEGRFIVGRYIPRVRYNRIRSAAKDPCPNSRVLHIKGPSSIVNYLYLRSLFSGEHITWQDEEVSTDIQTETHTCLEWRFGSYRCQAEAARAIIERRKKKVVDVTLEEFRLWQSVTVAWGVDPCAPPPSKGSFCLHVLL
ncbi:hypothetical protein O1611_g3280 [Lasiodiplodia mahajangana]|uniref:Uncharacterized protein n=1 Tax=Lasiodiplodia mahajangana TaxID=1108764 RepID=A0ACC2JSA3_9PEZI|nr:hypothetical protein O1611_g3280 [Lasiodiplodia mahajangana]